MPWLVVIVVAGLAASASVHHLGPALAVLIGTGVPLAGLALLSTGMGVRRLRAGNLPSGVALEALGCGSILLLVAVGRWAWINYF
jgi:hypothetical protein